MLRNTFSTDRTSTSAVAIHSLNFSSLARDWDNLRVSAADSCVVVTGATGLGVIGCKGAKGIGLTTFCGTAVSIGPSTFCGTDVMAASLVAGVRSFRGTELAGVGSFCCAACIACACRSKLSRKSSQCENVETTWLATLASKTTDAGADAGAGAGAAVVLIGVRLRLRHDFAALLAALVPVPTSSCNALSDRLRSIEIRHDCLGYRIHWAGVCRRCHLSTGTPDHFV